MPPGRAGPGPVRASDSRSRPCRRSQPAREEGSDRDGGWPDRETQPEVADSATTTSTAVMGILDIRPTMPE
ncbi:hypothetical protein H340_17939 [Streptomyces mobaraensis NBRC 13819 = DSM 40847]|uniref:Uncharacterized protein n=1 Tax=Streptomyces mobaraensis (strain ATCC 29032 / DSM 40847 / JCM 4168 / NBRC 13819 / NCIMB 11159 / IPCR 16-22) TaxID=1223523 RepID=M3C5D9_STRM1|nr:hypothetical protein H340_17939 [Streptomyces mobaraensis NBRC 13819 = DSM 40847]